MEAADCSEGLLGISASAYGQWKQLAAAKDWLGVSALVNKWGKQLIAAKDCWMSVHWCPSKSGYS